jgi:hypothetical protein
LGELSDHVHRLGYHFRTQIVEQAAAIVGGVGSLQLNTPQDQQKLDPIPEDQDEINRLADAAIRDLFPRIPNTDREMIVRHAFQKGAVFNGKPVVGLQEDITLSRRVQLAVVAHIRHTHTRYDLLLRETSWENARKAVESLCLDILVKWRGDEETGRDQLDEVLREIVVIDDSDNESESEDEDNGEEYEEISDEVEVVSDTNKEVAVPISQPQSVLPQVRLTKAQKKKQKKRAGRISNAELGVSTQTRSRTKPKERRNATKKTRKGFKRYKAWQEALSRQQNRRPDCPSPEEQASTSNIQQVHRSPDGLMNDTSPSYLSSGLQYQAIYAIDNYAYSRSRVSARFLFDASHSIVGGFVISTEPGQQPLPSQRTISLPESSYREQVIIRPRVDNLHGLEHTYGYDSRPIPIRSMQIDKSASQSSPVGMPGFEDRVIPSIEQAGDLGLEASPLSRTYGPVMHSQVRYNDSEPESRLVQNSSKIIYVDDLESQNKRQRILAGDPTHFPGSDYYVRIARTAAPAQHYLSEQPQRRIVNAVDRNDLSILDNRFERGSFTTAGRDCVIIDDEPRFVRVVGRSPEQTSFREQHIDDPQPYRRQRADNQPFLEIERPVLVMHAPVHKNERRSDPNQAYLSLVQERAPQPRLAADNSTYFSSLPSHPYCEMNSGLVSYPIISRTRHENNSRFSSAWNESIVSATKSSHQIPKEHIQVENHEINV